MSYKIALALDSQQKQLSYLLYASIVSNHFGRHVVAGESAIKPLTRIAKKYRIK